MINTLSLSKKERNNYVTDVNMLNMVKIKETIFCMRHLANKIIIKVPKLKDCISRVQGAPINL